MLKMLMVLYIFSISYILELLIGFASRIKQYSITTLEYIFILSLLLPLLLLLLEELEAKELMVIHLGGPVVGVVVVRTL